ncbi:MAG: cytochrome c, partial [Bacteroidota bacterium]
MKQSFFVFALLSSAFFAQAQDEITYSEHIAPIIYSKCTNCHRGGEIGPISFTSYEEVSEWAGMIKYVTQIKYMPPWPPNPEYNHFVGERVLDEEEIQMISDWVDAGTPRGDPAKEPPLPQFTSGSQVGTPDLVLSMSEQYSIEGNNRDDYRVFVLPTGFTEDTEIASIEFRPDNKRAVHHVLIAYDVSGRAAARDAQSPDVYGYPSFGDFGISEAVQLSWVYVPGISPVVYPEGIGHTIPAGADLLIQVHYAPLPTDEVDKSSVNIFFKDASDPIEREVNQGLVFPELLPNGFFDFVIRPNTKPTFTARGIVVGNQEIQNIPFDISL